MKYVLLYMNRPDLDAAAPPERRDEVYRAVFAWFDKFGASMTDSGAELQAPDAGHYWTNQKRSACWPC